MAKRKIKTSVSLASLQTKYEGSGIVSDVICLPDRELWVPPSSPTVSYRLGGGAAYGRIMEIAGFEGSGKTLLAMDLIRQAQRMGGVGIFVDAEYAFNRAWAELNGLDLTKVLIYQENMIEILSDFVAESCIYYRSKLTENEPIVLVLDSVAALDTMLAMNTSELDSKAEMGIRAKAIYKMLRIRNRLWHKLGITVVFINQLRDAINTGFAAKFKDDKNTVGGRAMKFYASQRIYLEVKKQLVSGSKDKKHKYGVEVMMEIKKNKLAIPRTPARFEVIFDPDYGKLGFNRTDGLVDILIAQEAVLRSGNTYTTADGEVIASSLAELNKEIRDDKDLRSELMEAAGIMTVTHMEDRLDRITENRYPVDGVSFVSHDQAKEEEDEDDE